MKKHRYLLPLVALALWSCQGDDVADSLKGNGDTGCDVPLSFAASRAETGTGTGIAQQYTNFGVWAWKTSVEIGPDIDVLGDAHTNDVPYEVRVNSSEEWRYDITSTAGAVQHIQYWDGSAASYRFAAYAPFIEDDGVTRRPATQAHTITHDRDGYISISDVRANMPEGEATDWVVALHQRDISPLFDQDLLAPSTTVQQPAVYSEIVNLKFHHILSAIDFRVYTSGDEPVNIDYMSLSISDAEGSDAPSYSITTKANYVSHVGMAEWQNRTDMASVLARSNTIRVEAPAGDSDDAVSLATLLEIPQVVKDSWLRVELHAGTSVYLGWMQLQRNWQSGKKYIYRLELGPAQNVILFDVDVQTYKWQDGNDIVIETPLDNW